MGTVTEVAAGDDALGRCDDFDVVVVGLRSACGLGPLGTIHRIARKPGHPSIVAIAPQGARWLELAAKEEGADEIIRWPDDEDELDPLVLQAVQPAYN